MDRAALGAGPFAAGQRHLPCHAPTVGAGFGTRVEAVERRQCRAVQDDLVLKLAARLAPRYVRDCTSEAVILEESFHVKVFNPDLAVGLG